MRTLVVIDAQSSYLNKVSVENYDDIVSNIQLMVNHWRKYDWPILFVEYGDDKTLHELKAPVYKYQKKFIIKKNEPNGAGEILKAIQHHNLPKELHVCGVNWNQCVQTTIYHLLKQDQDVKISAYRQASNPQYFRDKFGKYHHWSDMKHNYKGRFKVKY